MEPQRLTGQQLAQPEQQQPEQRPSQRPYLHALIPPTSSASPPPAAAPTRNASSTPVTPPGLFSPTNPNPRGNFPVHPASDTTTPAHETGSPYLHPLQNRKVRETHKALIDSDSITGRKLINQYEVIEEIGRGMHGKVKLARNLETGENVAIKIIPRYSKKRRLGKVMALSPQDKTMREIAILKKMRHPNVVSLLEIIDDPELRKIYLILEHVELGEVVWRKKGLPFICQYERRRVERQMRGELSGREEEAYDAMLERRKFVKDMKRAKMSEALAGPHDYWSMEHGVADEGSSSSQSRIPSADDLAIMDYTGSSLPTSLQPSRTSSRAPSRSRSLRANAANTLGPSQDPSASANTTESDMETPSASLPPPSNADSTDLDGTMYGAYIEEGTFRGRSPSMADSIISHMSSVDWNPRIHDPYAEDFSYVPCFTLEQARSVFRDTVLGLEYLHYQGVVHRDIKPANLLWTKDHRVKISDFGVSYFGRPIRDGEPDDEAVSESEAQDFDDDLELAKTVGTPAFFAPELCYTDAERAHLPKISEMIDIWSLGVTLYCIVFARIPFQAADEWIMFRKIASEEVFIPRRRLRPVDPSTPPDGTSLYKRHNQPPYRDDNELEYEDIDNLLYDLLRLMFTKNPEKRIRLRDIKRHPWVVHGIPNPIAWIDDTDPARPSQGRRVQVDAKETAHAVVPITILERARSAVKKAVSKVMHPLVSERGDSKTRRRATSSAASSVGDSSLPAASSAYPREVRRRSMKPDDYFSSVKDFASGTPDHPLSQSLAASPAESGYDPLATAIAQPQASHSAASSLRRRPSQDTSPLPLNASQRHSYNPSVHGFLALTSAVPESQTMPPTPCGRDPAEGFARAHRYSPQPHHQDELSRSHSVDRALFASDDKRALPQVGVTTALVPGTLHRVPSRPRPVRSIDLGKTKNAAPALASPFLFSPLTAPAYQHRQPQSDSNIYESRKEAVHLEDRPRTAQRPERLGLTPDSEAISPRQHSLLCAENSSSIVRDDVRRKQVEEYQQKMARQAAAAKANAVVDPAAVPCPPSPIEEELAHVSRESTMETGKSSRSTSMAGLGTPMTSPSEVASPLSSSTFPSKEQMVFQSDPSLPALLSGASSVSAELETDLPLALSSARPELLETTDSLTPPALTKEPIAGFPIEQLEQQQQAAFENGAIAVQLDMPSEPTTVAFPTPKILPVGDSDRDQDGDDDDSDSDGGLLMAKSKKKSSHLGSERTPSSPRH